MPRSTRLSALSSHQIAVVSLVIAVGGSVFSVYQYWRSDRQARIQAAIDISQKHIQDVLCPSCLRGRFESGTIGAADYFPKIEASYGRLEYAAFPANGRLADRDYYSMVLTCDIITMASQKDALSNSNGQPIESTEATKFAKQRKTDCPAAETDSK